MSSLSTHNSKSSYNVYFWKSYILPVRFQVTKVASIVESFKLLAVVLGPLLCAVVILVFWAVSAGILKEQTSILQLWFADIGFHGSCNLQVCPFSLSKIPSIFICCFEDSHVV
jgi:hypothetical protein